MKTALVLSAGGGFGAYQAGAWRVLSESLRPDIVIGASIGSLNGWAIAGGMPAGDLCAFWRDLDVNARLRFRWGSPIRGFLDDSILKRVTQEMSERYPLQLEYGAVLTNLRRMRPALYQGGEVTWQHLYGSCAVPFAFEQPRVNGTLHSDGGLLGALPLWAASEMGADRVIAISVWNLGFARFRKLPPSTDKLAILTPSERLGSFSESMFWNARHVERWMGLGERDARNLIRNGGGSGNISVSECFERQ